MVTIDSAANNYADVTITGVDTSKCFVLVSQAANSNSGCFNQVRGYMINGTTLRVQRGTANAAYVAYVAWQVIEFASGVSIQSGQLTTSAASHDVTISTVDLTKSFVVFSLSTGSSIDNITAYSWRVSLSTATNINFYRPSDTTVCVIQWYVITLA